MPSTAHAHEKWFVDDSAYPLRFELFFSLPVVVSLVTATVSLALLLLIRRAVHDPFFPNPPWLQPVNSSVLAVLGIQTAISLVYMAVQGWLLAPGLAVPWDALGIALLGLQLFASFTLITGWLTRLGGALLVGLVLVSIMFFPLSRVVEQLLFVGIGIFFLINGRGLFLPHGDLPRRATAFWSKYSHYALPILRIFTGLSILWLAFSEKLLNPGLALAFLDTRPEFNFMRLIGFTWFSDELFVYAAAAVEATVGVLLIAGVLPRIVILFMWVPFNITIPLLPPEELLGHLPILAVMYAVFLGESTPHLPVVHGTTVAQTSIAGPPLSEVRGEA
ncbi:MAG: hypothetical protein ABIO92_02925 [Chloroflexia bacterium]